MISHTAQFVSSGLARRLMALLAPLGLLALIAPMPVAAEDWRYTVRPGDTIWGLCREYTLYEACWQELGPYNNIGNARQLSPGLVLSIPAEWLKQRATAASAIYVVGEVRYSSASAPAKPLLVGTPLEIGTQVSVGEGSATLQFGDGSSVTMGAQTILVIDAMSAIRQTRSAATRISLPAGQIKVQVPKTNPRTDFTVETPAAVAAVRGTRFRVESEVGDASMRSEVLEGRVAIESSGNEKLLAPGYGLRARQGQPLKEPVALLEAPRWNLDCTDPGYVEWQPVSGAISYQLALLEDDEQVDRIIRKVDITDNSYTFEDLEPACYQVTVNAEDLAGFNGLESRRQLCYEPPLAAPIIVQARLRGSRLKASWSEVDNAARYRLEIASDAAFEQPLLVEELTAAALNARLQQIPAGVHLRVQALSEAGQAGEFSDPVYVEPGSWQPAIVGVLAAILLFAIL